MTLTALSFFSRRPPVPVADDDLLTLDRDGARSYSNVVLRTLSHNQLQLWSVLFTFLLLLFCAWKLHWSAHGLLAFVLIGAATTVVVDWLRLALAPKWVSYSHMREHRTEEMLRLVNAVERGERQRPAPRSLSPQRPVVLAARACTAMILPVFWCLSLMGWTSLDQVLNNRYLPLLLLVVVLWRLVRGYIGIVIAKGSTVGTRNLCLESDDALDTYVLASVLALLMLPLGSAGALALPFLIVAPRLIWRGYRYWWLRQSLQLLGGRVRRLQQQLTQGHQRRRSRR